MKFCPGCKADKNLSEFGKCKRNKDRLQYCCRSCKKERDAKNYIKHKLKIDEVNKKYYRDHRDKRLNYQNKYNIENREKINFYRFDRLRNDINFKLACRLRTRMNDAVKNNFKSGSSVRDLGCTIDYLKMYIESKFQEGMSWNNWSKDGWHIDHIKPLHEFDLSNREEYLKACHYTNLQPLWAKENLRKNGSTVINRRN